MTGTVRDIPANTSDLPVNVGDRIAWVLQYDRSLSPLNLPGAPPTYVPTAATLSHFVDLTTNTPLPSPPSNPNLLTGLSLVLNPGNINQGPAAFITSLMWSDPGNNGLFGFASLSLGSGSGPLVLPTSNLANLQLNTVPFDIRFLNYGYQLPPSSLPVIDLDIKADPLSSTPEPSSFVLLALGAVGLVAGPVRTRRMRRRSLRHA